MIATKLTAKRRAWLERLRDEGPAERDRSNVGYVCHAEGWTEWNYWDPAYKEHISGDEARKRYGDRSDDRWWDQVKIAGERITEAGRNILRTKQ